MKPLQQLVRPNILQLTPYSCARDEFKASTAQVYLDANENPYNSPLNRYPDPLQQKLKNKLSQIKQVPSENIFLGNGSDEAIDIIYRVFCRPQIDNVVAISPTYGMYQVAADINDVEYRPVALRDDFSLNPQAILDATDDNTKVIWLCSPNNPTGNSLSQTDIITILSIFQGIVVVDEAYGDFSDLPPFRFKLQQFQNLVVLNTFSKLWASAAIRLGIAYASAPIIKLFNKVKYPYNVNLLTQEKAFEILDDLQHINLWRATILKERQQLLPALAELPITQCVYPTDANFILVKVFNAQLIYKYLIDLGIVVRNRSNISLCQDCLRITIGTPQENNALLAALRQYR